MFSINDKHIIKIKTLKKVHDCIVIKKNNKLCTTSIKNNFCVFYLIICI